MATQAISRRLKASSALGCLVALGCVATSPVLGNPLGGQVTSGDASISTPDASTVQIDQTSNRAILEWQSFDIAPGETTRFVQPDSDAWALNRVVGSTDPTKILGTLEANGNIVIVNPDGIHFGTGSVVDVNRIIATTADISDENFVGGILTFDRPGNPRASIVNEGTITVKEYGLASFVAPSVRNAGTIAARLGTIGLAAGNTFTIDPYGDGLIKLAVGDEILDEVVDVATGETVTDLVKNEGTLKANGGTVAMTAATARKAVNSVVNNTGVTEANSVGMRGGKIILGAQTASTKVASTPVQTVRVSGTIRAASLDADNIPIPSSAPRGSIEIIGEAILAENATIDASGIYGGGTILIGGDYMGGNGDPDMIGEYDIPLEDHVVPTAAYVALDDATTVTADASEDGDGGKVIVWSDKATVTAAAITARGGENGGDGGFIETSGKYLSVMKSADASAPQGGAGTWLLDPLDVHIRDAADANFSVVTDVIYPGIIGNSASPTASPSVISTSNIEGALNSGTNVHVTTRGTLGGQPGDIYIEDDITKSSSGDVFVLINSANNIYFSQGVDLVSTSGAVTFHVFAIDGGIFGGEIGTIDVNGGQLLLAARDGVILHSTGAVPDLFEVDVLTTGPSPLPVINYDISFDNTFLSFSHDNTIATIPTNGWRFIGSNLNGATYVHFLDLFIGLENYAIYDEVPGSNWGYTQNSNRTVGAVQAPDGQPEIVARHFNGYGSEPTVVTPSGLLPFIEVESPLGISAYGAVACNGIYCVPTGVDGEVQIQAFLSRNAVEDAGGFEQTLLGPDSVQSDPAPENLDNSALEDLFPKRSQASYTREEIRWHEIYKRVNRGGDIDAFIESIANTSKFELTDGFLAYLAFGGGIDQYRNARELKKISTIMDFIGYKFGVGIDTLKVMNYGRNSNQEAEIAWNDINNSTDWELMSDYDSAFHSIGLDPERVSKYVNENGKEYIFYKNDAGNYEILKDGRNDGTFNLLSDDTGHMIVDIMPWILWGAGPEDPSSPQERLELFIESAPPKIKGEFFDFLNI